MKKLLFLIPVILTFLYLGCTKEETITPKSKPDVYRVITPPDPDDTSELEFRNGGHLPVFYHVSATMGHTNQGPNQQITFNGRHVDSFRLERYVDLIEVGFDNTYWNTSRFKAYADGQVLLTVDTVLNHWGLPNNVTVIPGNATKWNSPVLYNVITRANSVGSQFYPRNRRSKLKYMYRTTDVYQDSTVNGMFIYDGIETSSLYSLNHRYQ